MGSRALSLVPPSSRSSRTIKKPSCFSRNGLSILLLGHLHLHIREAGLDGLGVALVEDQDVLVSLAQLAAGGEGAAGADAQRADGRDEDGLVVERRARAVEALLRQADQVAVE